MNNISGLEQFLGAAKDYCQLIDIADTLQKRDFLKQVQGFLSRLYVLALELPEVTLEDEDSEDVPVPRTTARAGQPVYRRLSQYLGDANFYWMVFDPYDSEEHESITQALADDLRDIYWELQVCLSNNVAQKDLLWQLRFNFEIHWGHHLVNALTAVHSLLYGTNTLVD